MSELVRNNLQENVFLHVRRKRREQRETSENEKLKEEESMDEKEDMIAVEQIQREGTIALQDSLLNEMEKKHMSEQDVRKMYL